MQKKRKGDWKRIHILVKTIRENMLLMTSYYLQWHASLVGFRSNFQPRQNDIITSLSFQTYYLIKSVICRWLNRTWSSPRVPIFYFGQIGSSEAQFKTVQCAKLGDITNIACRQNLFSLPLKSCNLWQSCLWNDSCLHYCLNAKCS